MGNFKILLSAILMLHTTRASGSGYNSAPGGQGPGQQVNGPLSHSQGGLSAKRNGLIENMNKVYRSQGPPILHRVWGKRYGLPILHTMVGKRNGQALEIPMERFSADKRFEGPLLHSMLGKRDNQLDGESYENTNEEEGMTIAELPLTDNGNDLPRAQPFAQPFAQPLGQPFALPGPKHSLNGLTQKRMTSKRFYSSMHGPILHSMPGKRQAHIGAHIGGENEAHIAGPTSAQYGPLLHVMAGKRAQHDMPLLHTMMGKREHYVRGEPMVGVHVQEHQGVKRDEFVPLLHSAVGKRTSHRDLDSDLFAAEDTQGSSLIGEEGVITPLERTIRVPHDPRHNKDDLGDLGISQGHLQTENSVGGVHNEQKEQKERRKRSLVSGKGYPRGSKQSLLEFLLSGRVGTTPMFLSSSPKYKIKRPAKSKLPLLHQLLGYMGKRVGVPVFFLRGPPVKNTTPVEGNTNTSKGWGYRSRQGNGNLQFSPILHSMGGFGKRDSQLRDIYDI